MKKLFTLLRLSFITGLIHAQCSSWLPINMELSLNQYAGYSSLPVNGAETFVNDSIFYIMNNGGIEVINLNTSQASYMFSGLYYVTMLKADTGGNFLLVKNDTMLLRYHYPADTLETIPLPSAGLNITGLGRSTSYIWTLFNGRIVGRYNGQVWMLDTMTSSARELLVKNDTTGYLLQQNANEMFSFNGAAFNYNFALVEATSRNDPMDIDTSGNIWIADSTLLIKVTPAGVVSIASDSITTSNPTLALNVQTDNLGNVWLAGSPFLLYHFNGGIWDADTSYSDSYTPYTAINKNSGKFYDLGGDDLFTFYNSQQSYIPASDMPYTNICAMNSYYIATDQGIFQFNSSSINYYNYPNYFPAPLNFIDTSTLLNPYIRNVTCLVNGNNMTYVDSAHAFLYGTHHGVFGLNGLIDNGQLPDTNINYIYYADSIYYIGTDKGLCIYNNNAYTVIDTSNSPLPSDKITFVASAYSSCCSSTDTTLYIGTDLGLALHDSSGWRIFDTAYFHISNAYVTGIVPAGYYDNYYSNPYDSTIFISTLGSGLIALNLSGTDSIYNVANGCLTNDTLYNISIQNLATCGVWVVAAIPGAGLAYQFAYGYQGLAPFCDYIPQQITLPDSGAFRYFANLDYSYFDLSVFSPGAALGVTFGGCEGIVNVPAPQQQLKWNYDNNVLRVWLPETYTGPCTLTIYNLAGQVTGTIKTNVNTNAVVPIAAAQLADGFYVVQANLNGTMLQCKAVVDR